MNNEAIAEKIAERMHLLVNLPSELAEVERLRLIGAGIHQQIAETEDSIDARRLRLEELLQAQTENSKSLLAATQRVDDVLGLLYRPVDAPAAIVQEVAKKARGKKAEPSPVATPAQESPAEKHPCHICEDVFYNKIDLVRHLRGVHRLTHLQGYLTPKEMGIVSLCQTCLGDCGDDSPGAYVTRCPNGHRTEPDADQIAWRDSTCQEWRECQFTAKCFGPANEEDPICFKEDKIRELGEGALAAEKLRDQQLEEARAKRMQIIEGMKAKGAPPPSGEGKPCWNSSCAWSDLAKSDHCDADEEFRAGRPVAECGCLVTGDAPAKGQDGVDCINFECEDNRCQQGCNAFEEPWTCENYHSAGWGERVGEEGGEDENVILCPNDFFSEKGAIQKAFKHDAGIPDTGKLQNVFSHKGNNFAITGAMYHHGMQYADAYEMIPVAFWKGGDTCTVKARGAEHGKALAAGRGGCLKQTGCQVTWKKEPYILGRAVRFKPINPPTPEPSKEEPKQEAAAPAGKDLASLGNCVTHDCGSNDPSHPLSCGNVQVVGGVKSVFDCPHYEPRGSLNETVAQEEKAEREVPVSEGPTAVPGAGDAEQGVSRVFAPLDEPLGDCERCMGYGVTEGELFGESALVPCTCEAGLKVQGETWEAARSAVANPKCCEDCSIEDPDCASCHLPDLDEKPAPEAAPAKCVNRHCLSNQPSSADGCSLTADLGRLASSCTNFIPDAGAKEDDDEPAELPPCANGSCTATGKGAKEVCLRVGQLGRAPKDCTSFVPVDQCSHHMLKRSTREDGATVCDLCDKVLKETGVKPEPAPGIDPVQVKRQSVCTHPKVFREMTEAGEICKVCKLNLTQPSLL